MTRTVGNVFFERAVTIHRHDCEAVSATGARNGEAGDHDGAAGDLAGQSEAVVAYAVAARYVYDGVRRLIGHVAGLLVLVQAGGRRDVLSLPDVPVARERWDEIEERLRALRVPRGLDAHFASLKASHAALGQVLDDFGAARHWRDWERHLNHAGDRITFAYARLQAASEPRAGMTPVDFSHACCSCAQHRRKEGDKNGPLFDLGA